MKRLWAAVAAAAITTALTASPASAQRYGFVEFPKDEHQHVDGFDYWWGTADVTTKEGNRYTVGVAFDSFFGAGVTGHEVFAHQGPYLHKSILTEDGPAEWGHPNKTTVDRISTYLPGLSDLLSYETLDPADNMKQIGLWQRTSPDKQTYHLRIDDSQAKVHPDDKRVKLLVDLNADMPGPPLLAGGTGQWWYGIPETYHYPSRSFHYVQATRKLTGTIAIQQPDGTFKHEKVVPAKSGLEMIHEYDASPEDIPGGLAAAEATQLHERYPWYYQGGMPWELIFLDLKNHAQLMLAVMAFHDTKQGTITPIVGNEQPTYRVLATLKLPDGRSVPLDDALHVEHLDYRTIIGKVPTFMVQKTGAWTQAWDFRVSYPGGRVKAGDGTTAKVPPFDLGLTPQFGKADPEPDAQGNRLTQRLAFDAAGSYAGCPVHGYGWAELIIDWWGKEKRDPWYTGGKVPSVPDHCGSQAADPPGGPTGDLSPPADDPPPHVAARGCAGARPASSRRSRPSRSWCSATTSSDRLERAGGRPGSLHVRA